MQFRNDGRGVTRGGTSAALSTPWGSGVAERDFTADVAAALAGKYAIERELGSGGMATVYLGTDLKHQRDVAIKVLRPDLTVTIAGDRFVREIEIAARLQH